MKKLIPYILSYLLVASATAVFAHFHSRHANPFLPPNSVTVSSTLSHDELAARLQQLGLPEASVRTLTMRPAPLLSLVYHFVFYAVIFAAFAGLVHFFQGAFRKEVASGDPAA